MGAREDFQQLWDRFGRRKSAGREAKEDLQKYADRKPCRKKKWEELCFVDVGLKMKKLRGMELVSIKDHSLQGNNSGLV